MNVKEVTNKFSLTQQVLKHRHHRIGLGRNVEYLGRNGAPEEGVADLVELQGAGVGGGQLPEQLCSIATTGLQEVVTKGDQVRVGGGVSQLGALLESLEKLVGVTEILVGEEMKNAQGKGLVSLGDVGSSET